MRSSFSAASIALAGAVPLASAGASFVQTSASYSVTAVASGEYSETQTSEALGTASILLGDSQAGAYEADARLVAFVNDSIEIIAIAESLTIGASPVSCSTSITAAVGFSVPVATDAFLTATGSGGAGWSAVANEDGTASYTVTLTGNGGAIFARSAMSMSEVFELNATIPPGDYTLSVTSATSSQADLTPGGTSSGNCAGGVRLDLTPAAPGCNAADLATPRGLLDLADINAFVVGFTGDDLVSDLDENGVLDLMDITLFVQAFSAGCP